MKVARVAFVVLPVLLVFGLSAVFAQLECELSADIQATVNQGSSPTTWNVNCKGKCNISYANQDHPDTFT